MSPVDWLGAVATAVGLLLGLATLIGLAVRYALLPWLQTHIVQPVSETRRQVTVNGHVSATPTLLDRVDTSAAQLGRVRTQLDDVEVKVDDAVGRVNATARMLDGHLDRSAGEWGRLWDSIDELRDRAGLPPRQTVHHPPREDYPHG